MQTFDDGTEPAGGATPGDATSDDKTAAARPVRSARTKRRRSFSGALMAGAFTGLRDALEDRPEDREPSVVEASGTPHDVDSDGVAVDSGDQRFAAPPLGPLPSEVQTEHLRGARR